ncbi:MAG TPA: choice-of-anchor R domain-containing protein [Thermoanaerobaculia bacterium]|nr:choice-of-anchor R domain-containing protein [Thermoanaerobaculia bacterium]
MKPMAALLAGLGLAASGAAAAAQQVVYSNFLAQDGYYPDPADSQVLTDDGADPDTGLPTRNVVAVPFTVPAGPQYCVDHVEVEISQATGSPSLKLEATIGTSPGSSFFQAAAANLTEYPHLVSIPGSTVLAAGTTYYLQLTVAEPAAASGSAVWYANNAGIQDTFYENVQDGAGFAASYGLLPVFRILGAPCPAPAVTPSYSAFATLGSSPAAAATVRMEVSCPGSAQPLFVCPVAIPTSSGAGSAQVCQLLADGINRHAYPCWFPAGTADPAEPKAFHADCNGNNLRIANAETGLCPGAFVAADVVEDLTPPGARRAARFGSYEVDAIGGALQLEFGGAASGAAANPALPDSVTIVHRGTSSGQIFTAEVPLAAGANPGQIAALLGQALLEDRGVAATAKGLRFQAQEPSDVTVRVNDSSLHWALSPYPDLLEQSANHPPTLLPSCSSTSTQLCLHHGRFQVQTAWRTPQGAAGVGTAFQTTDDSGYFSFFSGNNLELVAKVVDACGLLQKFWFFVSGLTDVGVDVTVTDTLTGQTRTYHNAVDAPFQPILDTGAFAGCS